MGEITDRQGWGLPFIGSTLLPSPHPNISKEKTLSEFGMTGIAKRNQI
jgi:hypothetical protein